MTRTLTPEDIITIKSQSKVQPAFHISQLDEKTDRTLLYGYTCDRDTFHVYLKDGLLHRIIYSRKNLISHEFGESIDVELLIPNKRTYPETCDFDFCMKLEVISDHGVTFTTYNSEREEKQFHGEVAEDLEKLKK
jgi:hypothetical protein